MAPALGRLTAELITSGNASIDLSPFSVSRFAPAGS
jgi:glycine/D-amino acid oxidase-like deaminating enzyme